MSKKPRGLRPEERDLWQRVAEQSMPMHAERMHPVKKVGERINTPTQNTQLSNFRVGQKANQTSPSHNLTPHISDHLRSAPVNMDRKAYGKMKRGKLGPEGKIDLHGMTMAHAHPALNAFILSSHTKGRRLVLVITGKGNTETSNSIIPERRGVLRQQVPHWLTTPPLGTVVMQITPAHVKHGGDGAYYVYLRRRR